MFIIPITENEVPIGLKSEEIFMQALSKNQLNFESELCACFETKINEQNENGIFIL